VLFVISPFFGGAITIDVMETTRITVDEVSERLNRGEQFAFVDTRNPQAWSQSDRKLPDAIRVPADEVDQHLDEIPHDRAVITYCT
jgi:rhodanese-related sulfurtransferase